MKQKFNAGLIKAHVVMNLVMIDIEDKKVLEALLKGKSIIRGGGGKLDSLTDISAARIFENLKGEYAILGTWKFNNNSGDIYNYVFTPVSGKQDIIILEEIDDEQYIYLTFDNYKKL
ncbi:MAG: hypothetical protein BroJett017_27830 [Ignavibacteriota bacterium]|nr:MAG: hypothetical protein BroJett017_27830 [Ignavibacteriota bacterium]